MPRLRPMQRTSEAWSFPSRRSTGQDAGTATFQESKDGKQLTITVKLKNLPSGNHAVHIHQNPVCDAPDFKRRAGTSIPTASSTAWTTRWGTTPATCRITSPSAQYQTGEITYKVDYLTLEPGAADFGAGTLDHGA